MASSTVTSKEKLAKSAGKYPVLYDKSWAGFGEKQKQLEWYTNMAAVTSYENALLVMLT